MPSTAAPVGRYGRRACVAFVALGVLVLAVVPAPPASAHAALRRTDPAPDVGLEAAPTVVRLSFSEAPERSLSSIRVVDVAGTAYEEGPPQPAPDDPLALTIRLRPLDQQVYTVVWRVVSAVDGHPTAGAYTFGVGVSPTAEATAAAAHTEAPSPSPLELAARWIFLLGLVLLVGAAAATLVGFAGPAGALAAAVVGWASSVVGLVLLAEVQRRTAGASVTALWHTAVGRALAWRAAAVPAAGVALLVWRSPSGLRRRIGAGVAGTAAAAAMAVHVAAGHAAGGDGSRWVQVAGQWAHFLAAGVWVGGLVALVLGIRGAPSEAKAAAVRRFSATAAVALLVVVATGVARSIDQVPTRRELTAGGYGQAVVVKVGLVVGMAALGLWNRRRSVPRAAATLRGLRARSVAEIALGAAALATAAVLATVPPPASRGLEPSGLQAEGVDFARSVQARLTTQSPVAGPNRFLVRLTEPGSGSPVVADRVHLRFVPMDDPGVAPSTMVLTPAAAETGDGSYAGTGANLSFDGRWGVTVLVERGRDSVSVQMELHVRGAPQFLSVERIPGRPVRYTVEVAPGLYVRIHTEPGQVHAAFFDDFGTDRPVDGVVATATTAGRTRVLAARRVSTGRFAAGLGPGLRPAAVAIVARAPDGTRLRAAVDLH